jgi:hypothetical protein
MHSFRKLAVIVAHLAFVAACYATWAMGQHYAPELIGAQIVILPMILGIAGFWIWFGFWSAPVFRADGQGGKP